MSDYLELTFPDDISQYTENVNYYEFRNKPFSKSDVLLTELEDFKLLTKGEDVKRVYDLKLSTNGVTHDFLPGDTIGILPRNNESEIMKLLVRLNLESQAQSVYKLDISKNTIKKNPSLPKHIPRCGVIKDIFTHYIDIRKPPKKLFLKALANFTTDPDEVKRLQALCSPKGSKLYADFISGSAYTLLGLLNLFPTCFPPLEVILEYSQPLQPRYFSIASSPLEKGDLHITFFVMENPDGTKGVCTGWLEEIITEKERWLQEIPIYFRTPNSFQIPTDLSIPLIIIATGTGLAPFKGFLDHRLLSKDNGNDDIGDALLFYGCRYSDRDFLYSTEIDEYLNKGVLSKLYTAFSRDSSTKLYVQDRINENGEEFVDYLDRGAVVYVCGNMKTILKGVKEAIVSNLVRWGGLDQANAEAYLNELVRQNRFIVDSWT